MSADSRRIAEFHNAVATSADRDGVVIRFSGRNSAGAALSLTVHVDWWAWPMLVRSVSRHWILEREKRILAINDVDGGFPQDISPSPTP